MTDQTPTSAASIPSVLGKIEVRYDPLAVTRLLNGDYVVAWIMSSPTSARTTAFQRFSSDGSAVTSVNYLNDPSGVIVADTVSVIGLADGGYLIGNYLDVGSTRNFSYAIYAADNTLVSNRQYFGEPGWSYAHDNMAAANGFIVTASHSEAGGTGGYLGSGPIKLLARAAIG